MDWQDQLISVYLHVCKEYERKLCSYVVRLSNHCDMSFSDEEVLTLYLFGVVQGYSQVQDIHTYASHHLPEWFPSLPGYPAFIQRLNKLSHLFEGLVEGLLALLPIKSHDDLPALMDSFPIVLARQGRRFKACVAQEIATPNGYCVAKKLHYYGVKLHMIGQRQPGALPLPLYLGITEAGTADIKALDFIEKNIPPGIRLFADKAYQRGKQAVANKEQYTLYTPVKKDKGQDSLDAADRLLSTGISRIRQPIESLFNWIEQKTKLQIASKVRSFEGLMVHVFGKMAAALFMLMQRFCS